MRKTWKIVVPFLVPAILVYGIFIVYPYLEAFYVSMTYWRGVSEQTEFVGLANFIDMLKDPDFWNALKNTIVYTIADGVFVPIISLFFAVVLSRRLVKGVKFFRVVFFFPNLISVVAIATLWSFIFNPQFGIWSNFLKLVGLGGFDKAWLGDPKTAIWCIVAVKIWAAVGFYMVLYLSALEGIPEDFYDAGKIDGASEWQSFWNITLPLIREMIKVTAVFLLLNGLATFAIVQIMTNGGPNRHTDTMATYLYENAFVLGKFGYATAIAVALFLLTFILAIIALWLQRRETVQY